MAENEEYQTDLKNERNSLGPSFVRTQRLVDQELQRIQNGGKPPAETLKMIDVTTDKPIKVTEKVMIPNKQFPKYNFVGKLLGRKGQTLTDLQKETLTKMAILGRGSMRDKNKEEECRKEGGKYAHLKEDLHVLVEAVAPPAEAHSRIAHALSELKNYLIPEEEEAWQPQIREPAYLNGGESAPRGRGRGRPAGPPISAAPAARPARGGLLATPSGRGAPSRGPAGGPAGGPGGRGTPPGHAGRGALSRPASRPLPQQQQRAAAYDEGGYYEEYADQKYEEYDQGYTQTGEQYYEFGHASTRETYDEGGFEQYRGPEPQAQPRRQATYDRGESWAPPTRGNPMKMRAAPAKPEYRAHPYANRAGGGGATY